MDAPFKRCWAKFRASRPNSPVQHQTTDSVPGFALEPRIMLDAALLDSGLEALPDSDTGTNTENNSLSNAESENKKLAEALRSIDSTSDRSEVFLIDPSVSDYETLLTDIPDHANVHVLSNTASLNEIADVLSGYENLDAVHILSHGSEGSLILAGETIDSLSLASRQETLAEIGQSLNDEGDILLYGCEVGSGGDGFEFIQRIANYTEADVAASDDLTGSTRLGGNWVLEANIGKVDAGAFSANNFAHVLAATDENFQGGMQVDSSVSSFSYGSWTFTMGDEGGYLIRGGNDGGPEVNTYGLFWDDSQDGDDRALLLNYPGATILNFGFESADGSSFKLDSFDFGAEEAGSTSLTLTVYSDGSSVGSGFFDLSAESSSNGITYTLTNRDIAAGANIQDAFGTFSFDSQYENVDKVQFEFLGSAAPFIDNIDVSPAVLPGPTPPSINSSTYDASTGTLVVTGTDFVANDGVSNDINVSLLTLTGEGGASYTLTSANVEIDSATQFTVNLNAMDQLHINGLLNSNGTASGDSTTYNLSSADNWMPGAETNISDTTNGVTVSNVSIPTITSATYNASTGVVVITGEHFVHANGDANDVDVSTFTFSGEEGNSYTLTSATNVEITSATQFTMTLSAEDQLNVQGLLNKNGLSADDSTTYNLAAADNWMTGAAGSADIVDASNAITVNNVTTPAITSATYDASTGVLVVTGTNFYKAYDTNNDIDASLFTLTGEAGGTYTLTDTSDVEITSATEFSITLSSSDLLNVNGLLNKEGTTADSGTTYNLSVAEDWMPGAATSTTIADLSSNEVTVSNVAIPTIASATYDASTGALVVTGTGFVKLTGANNDIVASLFTLTGEGANTYTLTDSSDVDITSGTSFTIHLSATDQLHVHGLLNKNGTASDGNTVYNLAAADDWVAGAASSANIANETANAITVSNVSVPAITSATYDASSGVLVVTGTGFVKQVGADNDIDASTFTLTGEAGAVYNLTDTSDVEITSATEFTITLSSTDLAGAGALFNKAGTESTGATTYNLAAADNWMTGVAGTVDIADATGNGIDVSNVNVAPSVDNDPDNSSGNAPGFENSFAAGSASGVSIVDDDFTITDTDDTHIESAVITLSAGVQDGANESLSIDGTPGSEGSISITYTSDSQIDLSGLATKAEYEAVIKQIVYSNSSSALTTSTGDRTVSITVTDDGFVNHTSAAASSTISVIAAPIVDTGPGKTFTENDSYTPASVIDASATITDADSPNLSQMVISLTNSKTDDLILLDGYNHGAVVSGITITYDSDAQVTLTGTASKADYLALLKDLQFSNSSQDPDTTLRTLSIVTTDSDGNSGTANTTVTVQAVDDPSVVTGTHTGNVTEANVGDADVTTTGTLGITDVDGSPAFNDVGTTAGSNGYGSFVLASGVWTYTLDQSKVQQLDAGDVATDTITYTATDGTSQTIAVTIYGSDDVPLVSGTLTGAVTEGDEGDTVTASGGISIVDVDSDDIPFFTGQPATTGDNGYGSFGFSNGVWTYTLDQAAVQYLNEGDSVTDRITFTASDGTTQVVSVEILGSDEQLVQESVVIQPPAKAAPVETSVIADSAPEPAIPDPVDSSDGTIVSVIAEGLPVEAPTSDVEAGAGSASNMIKSDSGLISSGSANTNAFSVQGLFNQQGAIDARYGTTLVTGSESASSGNSSSPATISSAADLPAISEFEAEQNEERLPDELDEKDDEERDKLPEGQLQDDLNLEEGDTPSPEDEPDIEDASDRAAKGFSSSVAMAVDSRYVEIKQLLEALIATSKK